MRVGIGDAQRGENACFQRLHLRGVGVDDVVVTDKMQQAVERQVLHVMDQGNAKFGGFAYNGFVGNDDIAEVGWRAGLGENAVINDTGFPPEIAKVTADIKTRPVIGGIDGNHGRLRVRPRRQIRSGHRDRTEHSKCRGKQKLIHLMSLNPN